MKRSIFGLFVGAILLFATIASNFNVLAEEFDGAEESIIKSVSVYANGDAISEGDTISLDDQIQVDYKLASPLYMNYEEGEKEDGNVYLSKGDVIYFPQIVDTAFDISKIQDFNVNLDDGTNFGKGSITSDRRVKLEITYSENSNVNDVVVSLDFGIDSSVIGDDDEYTFQLPGLEPKSVTMVIDENTPDSDEPKAPKDVTSVTKEGGVIDENGKASWEITVGNNGVDLSDVVLYDYFSIDNRTDFKFDTTNIVVTDETGATLQAGVDYEVVYNNGKTSISDSGQRYSWALKFGEMKGDKKYSVTYDTEIGDYETFLLQNHTKPSNKTWVEYNYVPENGTEPVSVQGVGVQKSATGTNLIGQSALDKQLIAAEPATHQLTWAVYVNKNYRQLTNAKVVENLGEGQKFVSVSEIKIYDRDWRRKNVVVTPTEQSDGSLLIDFGDNLNEATASFTVTTELTDEEVALWEANSDRTYRNSVTMTSDQQASITDTANGKCKWKEDVLEKAGSVDKKNKNIVYTININQQRQVLPERLQIRDVLGKNLVVDPESVKLYIGSVNSNGTVTSTNQLETGYTSKITVEGENQVLLITLPAKSNNRNAYVLKYVATPDEIFEAGDYTNIVRLLGYGYTNSIKDRVSFSYKAFGGGWVEKNTKPNTNEDVNNEESPKDDNTNTNPSDNTNTPSDNTNPGTNQETNPDTNTGNNSGSNSNTGNSGSGSGSTEGNKTGTPSANTGTSSSTQTSDLSSETTVPSTSDSDVITIPDEKTALAGPKKDSDVVGEGETNITAGADTNSGNKLAKTGGFLGTSIAYIAGIVLILIGCVLIRGQKKFGEEK